MKNIKIAFWGVPALLTVLRLVASLPLAETPTGAGVFKLDIVPRSAQ